jgi:hypothetical protein
MASLLLPILERQADGLVAHPGEVLRGPMSEAELEAELVTQLEACLALAEVARPSRDALSAFELAQLVIDAVQGPDQGASDETGAAMIEDVVAVVSAGASVARLRRRDPWQTIEGVMAAIVGLARLVARDGPLPPSGYVRLAFDEPLPPPYGTASASVPRRGLAGRSTAAPMPSDAMDVVRRWAAALQPPYDPDVVDPADVVLDVGRRGRSITLSARMRAERGPGAADPVQVRIAQLRWVPADREWTLHWADSNDRWHRFDQRPRSADLAVLLDEIASDRHGRFW